MTIDALTGCPERRLEPQERPDQSRINRLHRMIDARFEIAAKLDEYRELFPEEIKIFLEDINSRVADEMEDER